MLRSTWLPPLPTCCIGKLLRLHPWSYRDFASRFPPSTLEASEHIDLVYFRLPGLILISLRDSRRLNSKLKHTLIWYISGYMDRSIFLVMSFRTEYIDGSIFLVRSFRIDAITVITRGSLLVARCSFARILGSLARRSKRSADTLLTQPKAVF